MPTARTLSLPRPCLPPTALHCQVTPPPNVSPLSLSTSTHIFRSFGAMRSAGQAACIGQGRNQLPSLNNRAKNTGLALVQDVALAEGWVACSFTFQGFSIAAFRANESPLRIGADTFCFRAALFDVARPQHDDGDDTVFA